MSICLHYSITICHKRVVKHLEICKCSWQNKKKHNSSNNFHTVKCNTGTHARAGKYMLYMF